MLLLQDYLKNPCGTSSIPYWKQKKTAVPENMKIIHEKDYDSRAYKNYYDEPYFRLCHNMKNIEYKALSGVDIVSGIPDIEEFVNLINESYNDLRVTKEQLEGYGKTSVFRSDLWITIKDKVSGKVIAGGIADYDGECRELILEWIQVLPSYRGHGYGKAVVNCLLSKMQGIADFATVSGKANNPTNPETLYRKCGFTGNDIWHILTKKG